MTIARHNGNMINLIIENNYIQLGEGEVKQSGVVSGSVDMHMFSSTQPACLLIGAFNAFTFKVIINMYDPIPIFLIALGLFSIGRSFPSLCFLPREVLLTFVKLVNWF